MTTVRLSVSLVSAGLLALVSTAQAATVLIDFGQNGAGFVSSGNWNNFAQSTSYRFSQTSGNTTLMLENMIDSSGQGTSIDLYFTGQQYGSSSSGVGGIDYDVPTTTSYPQSATRDGIYLINGSSVTTSTFELRDLAANEYYDLTFFATSDSAREDTTWTVDGESVVLNPTMNTTTTVTLSSVQADENGVVEITWKSPSAGNAGLWGTLEIVAVPEPATAGFLVGALALSAVAIRRRVR